jgi:hypothetical protein
MSTGNESRFGSGPGMTQGALGDTLRRAIFSAAAATAQRC